MHQRVLNAATEFGTLPSPMPRRPLLNQLCTFSLSWRVGLGIVDSRPVVGIPTTSGGLRNPNCKAGTIPKSSQHPQPKSSPSQLWARNLLQHFLVFFLVVLRLQPPRPQEVCRLGVLDGPAGATAAEEFAFLVKPSTPTSCGGFCPNSEQNSAVLAACSS